MKIALVHPNNPFLTNERVFPSMGIVRVGTELKKEGHDVEILDFSGRDPEEIKERAHDFDFFGFTSTSPQFPYTMQLFRNLKEANPKAKTILGGPHASALYHLKQRGVSDINIDDLNVFDTIFAGEGENTENIFKPGWQKGELIKNIDDVAIPDRELIDIESYKFQLFGSKTTNIQTQRGCPYQCKFCSGRDVEMYNKVRTHSPERVIKEMDAMNEKYGYTSFMWYDDEINLNMGRLEKLCGLLAKKPYTHRGFVRSDGIVRHPESVQWMKAAGFVKLCAGVESGSDRILDRINKQATSEMHSKARKIIGDAGIHYEAFVLVGHPGETIADVIKSYNWIRDNKPDDFDINVLTPYPGSKIYDNAIPSDTFPDYKWEYDGLFFNKPRYSKDDSFYKGLDGKSESSVRTLQLPNDTLRALRDSIDTRLKK